MTSRTGAPRRALCLNMIVRNEAAIIERCLDAVADVVDACVICDTGSTDDTPQRIRAWLDAHGMPGEIHRFPFVDFAQARNEALARCRASALPFTHILLADADMELVVDDPPCFDDLGDGAWQLEQRNGLVYWNTRIVQRDFAARYVGATHEYVDLGAPPQRLYGAWFRDHGDGGSRGDKFERDERLLRRALAERPGDPRTLFYLARTLHDLGRYDEARAYYAQRAAAGGWEEERWYAQYALALCAEAAGDTARAVADAEAAFAMRAARAEPLLVAARALRVAGHYEDAMGMCERGSVVAWPAGDALFVDRAAYRYGFDQEASIAGFYCASEARQRAGDAACGRLATARDVPAAVRDTARRNEMHYACEAVQMFGAATYTRLAPPVDAPWHAFNPSLARAAGGVHVAVRLADYTIRDGTYTLTDGAVRSRTLLATLAADDTLVGVRELDDRAVLAARRVPGARIQGCEDVRLFGWNGRWHALATVRDLAADARAQVVLLAFADDGVVVSADVLQGHGADRHQKNWLPFVDADGDLLIVYGLDPLTILRYDPARRDVVQHRSTPVDVALDHLRGGTAPIPFDDGWLWLVHESIDVPGHGRCYLHRFATMDRGFRLRALTRPFCFTRRGIEFAMGLVADGDDTLRVSFGVDDAQAWLARLPAAGVRAMLEPV
ncbi:MAG: glycosyltransferase [Proteobacteria bacterium]|nr:glycosyltransferase [Pseudomonadota bacterium]